MTKVETRFALSRPLDDVLLARVAAAHGIYGILRMQARAAPDSLEVEYDATRLDAKGVENVLRLAGIPVIAMAR